jgi:hypothetical protein
MSSGIFGVDIELPSLGHWRGTRLPAETQYALRQRAKEGDAGSRSQECILGFKFNLELLVIYLNYISRLDDQYKVYYYQISS